MANAQFNGVACGDVYTDAATIRDVFNSGGGVFEVDGQPATYKLQYGGQGIDYWTDEATIGTGGGEIPPGVTGVAFRNSVAGSISTVSALIRPRSQPHLALSFASPVALASVLVPNIAVASFPPASPVDTELNSIILPTSYDQTTSKNMRWLVEFDAAEGVWWVHDGKPIVKQDFTHTFGYTGAGAFQDPTGTLTGIVPVTVPRPGLYRCRCTMDAQDVSGGGSHDIIIAWFKNGVIVSGPQQTNSSGGSNLQYVSTQVVEMIQCVAGDSVGVRVAVGVNGINFFNALMEVDPQWIT